MATMQVKEFLSRFFGPGRAFQALAPRINQPHSRASSEFGAEVKAVRLGHRGKHLVRAAAQRNFSKSSLPGLILLEGIPIETNRLVDVGQETIGIRRLE